MQGKTARDLLLLYKKIQLKKKRKPELLLVKIHVHQIGIAVFFVVFIQDIGPVVNRFDFLNKFVESNFC